MAFSRILMMEEMSLEGCVSGSKTGSACDEGPFIPMDMSGAKIFRKKNSKNALKNKV